MAVELYIDVLILEDDWCINWLMWKCGIRVLTGDIALISTDDPPTWNSGHFTGWGFPLRASLRWNCRCLRTSLQHEHLNKYKCKSLWSCTVFKEFQKLVNKAKSLLHTTFYVQLLTLKSKHFTVTLEVKREIYREMELSQVTYRGSWISANLVAEEKEEGELADGKKEMARRHSSEKEENVEKQKRQRTEVWWGGRGNNNKVSGVNSAVGCPE